ncbi:MAG TPA: GNAT family N-acetyltransferase [Microvirga sp.]|nr:GNAT family N-acetyltransferase [Microvirga sp.]
MPETPIRTLGARETEARLAELGHILHDAVEHGASVNFVAGFTQAEAEAFWRGQLAGLAAGDRALLVAEEGGRLLGTVIVFFAHQPNAPHRAEIGKMLVHSAARRRGLGQRLLGAAEEFARAAGRTLLVLDTHTGSDGERLYRRCGWTEVGQIPDHSLTTDGHLAPTTIFYKRVA